MSWYNEPVISGLIGALAGALISAAVSLYIWRRTNRLVRVDCAVDDAKSLLSFASNIGDKLEVKYDGEVAAAVYLFQLEVANTGTEPVDRQPIRIRLGPGAKVLKYSVQTEPPIGFGDIVCTKQDANELCLEVALLNPKDRVFVEVISINNADGQIDVGLKNRGVDARVYSRRSAESVLSNLSGDLSLSTFAVLSALPIVGNLGRALTTIALARRIDAISGPNGKSPPN
jgi:hypothetical protein